MPLYHKYRPETLDEMYGNAVAIASIKADFTKKDKPHAVLLHGPTGCGKTTAARVIAKMLNCSDMDFHEVDSADFRGIDSIREIRRASGFKSITGENKVWLLDECHKLSSDAMNALLKALEDPPAHVYYVLATTEPTKLLPTIRGRCAQYQMAVLTDKEMFRLLRRVAKEEGQSIDEDIIDQIIIDAQGHPRDALQILDQTLAVDPDQRLETAKRSGERQSATIELCRALMNRSTWKIISAILNGLKTEDPESIRRAVLGYCNSVLLKGSNDPAALIMDEFIEPFYNSGFPMLTYVCYKLARRKN